MDYCKYPDRHLYGIKFKEDSEARYVMIMDSRFSKYIGKNDIITKSKNYKECTLKYRLFRGISVKPRIKDIYVPLDLSIHLTPINVTNECHIYRSFGTRINTGYHDGKKVIIKYNIYGVETELVQNEALVLNHISNSNSDFPDICKIVGGRYIDNSLVGIVIEHFDDFVLDEDLIKKTPESTRTVWVDKIRRCIKQLHSAGIYHGDIKPNNIMVSGEDLRVIDFDGSSVPSKGIGSPRRGTEEYSLPEHMNRIADEITGSYSLDKTIDEILSPDSPESSPA